MSKARVISINLQAGTAQFFRDLDGAEAKLKAFGTRGVNEARATTAAMKLMEGQFFNNTRAADKFLESFLGFGKVSTIVFPLVGGLAFAGMLTEIGHKLYEFYKNLAEAPEKIGGAFRGLNESLKLTNDGLRLANDRLDQDIAKLEGKHENTLKIALDEAKVSADNLADSLDKDLAGLHKVLEENKSTLWQQVFGRVSDKGLREEIGGETGFGGWRGRINEITDEGREKISAAKTPDEAKAARKDLDASLRKFYADIFVQLDKEIEDAKEQAIAKKPTSVLHQPHPGSMEGAYYAIDPSTGHPARDTHALLEELTRARKIFAEEDRSISLKEEHLFKTQIKEGLEAGKGNAAMDRPFNDRMERLKTEIEGVNRKFESIGKPEAVQVAAKAFSEAQKAVDEVNKALERFNKTLTPAEEMQIWMAEGTLATAQAEEQWQSTMVSGAQATEQRIRSQQLLTDAIGKGYSATRQANIETRLMQALGVHANDPAWMQQHQAQAFDMQAQFGREFDAEHARATAEAIDKLGDQIELEKALVAAQKDGVEAVRQATLAVRLRQLADKGATQEQIKAEMDLFNLQRENASAAGVANIQQRIAATEKLTKAIFAGAEAERKAALEAKYAEMTFKGASAGEVSKQRELDIAERQRQITAEAMKTGLAFQNNLESLNGSIAELQKIKKEQGDSLAIELAMRHLENERLHVLTEESLAMRGAKDGVRAFFIEMQTDAKSAAQTVYEALNSSVDRASANFAKLLTRQKTEWGQAMRDIGEQMLQSTLKSGMQKTLGALGKAGASKPDGKQKGPLGKIGEMIFGKAEGKPDGSSQAAALLVKIAGATPGGGVLAGIGGGPGAGGGKFGDGSMGGGIFSFLATAFGGFRAEGGNVEPGRAYEVGERGPERFVPHSAGTIVPAGSSSATYHIDARGADLGAYNRIARGIEASHRSAVSTAVRATHEQSLRVPSK